VLTSPTRRRYARRPSPDGYAEKALAAVIQEAYVYGVSTRSVTNWSRRWA